MCVCVCVCSMLFALHGLYIEVLHVFDVCVHLCVFACFLMNSSHFGGPIFDPRCMCAVRRCYGHWRFEHRASPDTLVSIVWAFPVFTIIWLYCPQLEFSGLGLVSANVLRRPLNGMGVNSTSGWGSALVSRCFRATGAGCGYHWGHRKSMLQQWLSGGIPWPTFRWCLWWWFWGNSKWNGWQVDSSYSSMVFWLIDFGPTSLVDLDDWHQIEGLWVAHIQNDMIGSPKCGRHLTAVNKRQKLQGSPGPSFVEGVECWIVPEMGKKEAAWPWSVSRNDRTGMSWTVMKHPNCHHGWITSY